MNYLCLIVYFFDNLEKLFPISKHWELEVMQMPLMVMAGMQVTVTPLLICSWHSLIYFAVIKYFYLFYCHFRKYMACCTFHF